MKPEYHQSNLKHYLRCPKMFALSLEFSPEFGSSTEDAMRDGNLFEGYTLGFKSDKDEATLIGRKKIETIDKIKVHANFAKNIFTNKNHYVKLRHELPEYVLVGEADNIGKLNWELLGKIFPGAIWEEETINDLKYTKSIDYGQVAGMESAYDYFQALQYVSINYLNTGKILPFIYLIVENNYTQPLLKMEKVFIHKTDIEQKFLPFVDKVHNDLFKQASPGFETCLGGKQGSRCWFLQFCEKGREFAGGYKTVEFAYLPLNGEE
jgi:hypothetical protein